MGFPFFLALDRRTTPIADDVVFAVNTLPWSSHDSRWEISMPISPWAINPTKIPQFHIG